ncbi:MAG: hypothetical protein V4664_02715 [Patescibacteria group bacterium]
MKQFLIKYVFLVAIFGVFFAAQIAQAATPVLTFSNAGNSQVRIDVTGDVNSSVQLYFYNPPNSGNIQSAGIIGTTNSSGYFTTIVSNTAYGIPVGTSVFVNVNNQQSSGVAWPTITGGNVYLGQTNIYLNVNQSGTVTISGGTGTYYISTNSNSNVATASINGSVLTVNGINNGNTTFTVCSASTASSCATLYVSVGGGSYNNNQSVYFDPTTVSVQAGQTQSVIVYGSGSYYLSNNSNTSVVSVTISGSNLNVYGITNGSATLTVCSQTSNSSCGSLYVTVYSSYNNYCSYNCYPYNNYPINYNNSYYPYPSTNNYYYYNYTNYNYGYPSGFYSNYGNGFFQTSSGGGFVLTSSH